MRAVIVYESMFGATRQVAEAISEGLGGPDLAKVVNVRDVTDDLIETTDLLVVGGPTHVHGMVRPRTRRAAAEMAQKPDKHLHLEPGATEPGLREWFDGMTAVYLPPAAAFDTRMSGPSFFTGRASRRIERQLEKHGARFVSRPRSFLIAHDEPAPGQLDAARKWGQQLAETVPLIHSAA
jgi:flavodoxin